VKFLQCIAGLDLSLTGTGIATFTHGNVAVQTIDGTPGVGCPSCGTSTWSSSRTSSEA
jgi:hypothetical protein